MIPLTCPKCGAEYTVPDDKAGLKTTCRTCGRRLHVPDAEADDASLELAPRRRPAKPLAVLALLVWIVTAGVTGLGLVVWFLLMKGSQSAVQEASVSAAGAFVVVAVYVLARAAENGLGAVERLR